jgi:hypothetical protein
MLQRNPKSNDQPPGWSRAFKIFNPAGQTTPDPRSRIFLEQTGDDSFALQSRLVFTRNTGLNKFVQKGTIRKDTIDDITELRPDQLTHTDLASVPRVFRWLLASYGAHTPAVLIHDRLIGWKKPPEGWRDTYADRYLRFMLKASGVSLLTRWLMWTAVALRTRWSAPRDRTAQRIGLGLWCVLALVGIAAAVVAVVGLWLGWPALPGSFGWPAVLGSWGLPAIVALALPIPASALWGRQAAAGLICVVCAPWVFPPAIIGAAGYGFYWVLDRLTSLGHPDSAREATVTASPFA